MLLFLSHNQIITIYYIIYNTFSLTLLRIYQPKSWQMCLYILTKGVIEILSFTIKLGRL